MWTGLQWSQYGCLLMIDADTLEPEYAGDEFDDVHLKLECKSSGTVGNGCRVTSIYSVCRLDYF